ncbi:MAG: phosphoribosyltransferase [Thermoproteota archaeon]|nr:phosphoribosyltransferase [Thermoproteota archaeon]NLD65209.1 phosphoribosyltransferase [Thermoproteota archaeon]
MVYFSDRKDAGKQLASALTDFSFKEGMVLAIPRGGVVVGYEIASALNFKLDVIIPRKIGTPDNPELAIGAVTEDGTMILDDSLIMYLGVSNDYIYQESERQKQEIRRRQNFYRQGVSEPEIKDKNVIVVDDGIATGYTMKAALASVRNRGAATLTVAIPVGPPSTIKELKHQADNIVCLYTPEYFQAIGQFYSDFSQTTDKEVIELLKKQKNLTTIE